MSSEGLNVSPQGQGWDQEVGPLGGAKALGLLSREYGSPLLGA